ncbi:MAG: cell division protein FtsZ [Synergistaceae bacterium]|jgi:cell division protein FtsZ|nr:cell division protein FtsZ [Synergistaceae bacterium]
MEQNQFFHLPEMIKQREHILVIGVGGGGGNALDHIIESGLDGVEYVAANTDSKALGLNKAPHKILLGEKLTKGRGAGADPQVGMDAAKESLDHIRQYIEGAEMAFITAGMGGGTGTGAAPIIAEVAKEMNVLVVGVVTTPFSFELKKRAVVAKEGITRLREKVDALLVVENDRLMDISTEKTTIAEAYKMANEVLRQAVQGVTDLILKPGVVNLDFADIRTIMKDSGSAIMGIGEGQGDNRAEQAAKNAIKSPLMSLSLEGAKGVLLNIEGPSNLTIVEMKKAVDIVTTTAGEEATVIWGHIENNEMSDAMRITVIATGFPESKVHHPSSEEKRPPSRPLPSIRPKLLLSESDLQPSGEEDIFVGIRTPSDVPTYLRKNQK